MNNKFMCQICNITLGGKLWQCGLVFPKPKLPVMRNHYGSE